MSKYSHHLLFVVLVSIVTLTVNIFAFYTRNVTNYLYLFGITYAIGNSAHFVVLSISSTGLRIKDEKKST